MRHCSKTKGAGQQECTQGQASGALTRRGAPIGLGRCLLVIKKALILQLPQPTLQGYHGNKIDCATTKTYMLE